MMITKRIAEHMLRLVLLEDGGAQRCKHRLFDELMTLLAELNLPVINTADVQFGLLDVPVIVLIAAAALADAVHGSRLSRRGAHLRYLLIETVHLSDEKVCRLLPPAFIHCRNKFGRIVLGLGLRRGRQAGLSTDHTSIGRIGARQKIADSVPAWHQALHKQPQFLFSNGRISFQAAHLGFNSIGIAL
jgi:hypothetical protein